MKKRVLFIHNEKKQRYGAHFINSLIIDKLRKKDFSVDTIYPKDSIEMFNKSMGGIRNILFFYSLINRRKQSYKYDFIQGTTYTLLPFLGNGIPTIAHFGSTTYGFLKETPSTKKLSKEKSDLGTIFSEVKKYLMITDRSSSIKAIRDTHNIEIHVAKMSDFVIATSQKVKDELIQNGVSKNKITVLHNAIEDYWFDNKLNCKIKKIAGIVYIGRMGDDVFTIKLKGINRLVYILKCNPDISKIVIGMCNNIIGYQKLFNSIPYTKTHLSLEKIKIPKILRKHYGDIYINPGRYEGFCLSLVESMSQGLIPITFPIGVAPEIISNGKNGYIVHSLDEMNAKIAYLKNNYVLRKKMAVAAIKTANNFKAERLIDNLIKMYANSSKS